MNSQNHFSIAGSQILLYFDRKQEHTQRQKTFLVQVTYAIRCLTAKQN